MADTKKVSKKSPKKAAPESTSKLSKVRAVVTKMLDGDDDDCIVKVDPEQYKESLPHFPTTSIVLDSLISGRPNLRGISPCPGWPRGRFIQLYGPASSGKTTTSLHAAASVCRQGGCVGYLDFENEVIPEYAKTLGVPVDDQDKFQLFMPKTFEEGASIAWGLAHAGVDLIIIDSIPAAVPKALVEKTIGEIGDKGQIGINAQLWSAFLPKLRPVIRQQNVTVLGISQVRANISGYGDPTTIPGGNAWQFYSALRMRLTRKEVVKSKIYSVMTNKGEEQPIGMWVQAKLDKCKVSSQQGAEAKFFIRFGEGIDNISSLIEIALAHGIVKREGAWYRWTPPNAEQLAFQGAEKLWSALKTDPLKAATLEKQVRPYLTGALRKGTEGDDEEGAGDENDPSFDPNNDAGLMEVMAALAETTAAELAKPPRKSAASRILEKMDETSGDES